MKDKKIRFLDMQGLNNPICDEIENFLENNNTIAGLSEQVNLFANNLLGEKNSDTVIDPYFLEVRNTVASVLKDKKYSDITPKNGELSGGDRELLLAAVFGLSQNKEESPKALREKWFPWAIHTQHLDQFFEDLIQEAKDALQLIIGFPKEEVDRLIEEVTASIEKYQNNIEVFIKVLEMLLERHGIEISVVCWVETACKLLDQEVSLSEGDFEDRALSAYQDCIDENSNGSNNSDNGDGDGVTNNGSGNNNPNNGNGGSIPMPQDPVVFRDLAEREFQTRQKLQQRLDELKAKQSKDNFLRQEYQDEFNYLESILDEGNRDKVIDPLYNELQKEFESYGQNIPEHIRGTLGQERPLTNAEVEFVSIYGILQHVNAHQILDRDLERWVFETDSLDDLDLSPEAIVARENYRKNTLINVRRDRYFLRKLADARGEYKRNSALYEAVLPLLITEGDKPDQDFVKTEQLAAIVTELDRQGVKANDDLLGRRTKSVLEGLIGAREDGPPSNIIIDLPELEEAADLEIVIDNLHATQAIYFASMLDQLGLWRVVEKLIDLWQLGALPFGRGKSGDILYSLWRKSSTRMSEVERQGLFSRTLGFVGGAAWEGMPNREFSELWLRFIAAVSEFARQFKVDNLLRSNLPVRVNQENVRKSGRDLAANLSLHGYGMAWFAATELQEEINEFITLLSDEDVKQAYGARDMWQVIEQVSALELGGVRNSIRHRTMATSGAVIIRWLADRATLLTNPIAPLFDIDEVRFPGPRQTGKSAMNNPRDSDLVNACESWLAVTGTASERIEQYSDPIAGPVIPSRPIQIPGAARDLLGSVGIETPNS